MSTEYLKANIKALSVLPTLEDKQSLMINEKEHNFKVLNLQGGDINTSDIFHHIILSIDRSGSMDSETNGETKMNQTKHTLINIFRWSLDNNYKIKFTVVIFDNIVDILFEDVTITKENILEFISIINIDIFARNATDIGSVFETVERIKNKHAKDNVKTSHIFMTDGIPTSGVVKRDDLVKLLPNIENQYFIGFGVDHDSQMLTSFAKNFANSYYFVDCMENTGNVYGEVLNNIVNNLLEEITIEGNNHLIYDSKNNEWTNTLVIKDMANESQKNIYLKVAWKDVYKKQDKNKVNIHYKLNKFIKDKSDGEIKDINETYEYNTVYKHLWKHMVLETLYKYKTNPLNCSKTDLKDLMDNLKKYITDKKLENDEFMKVLLDDLYISYKTCDKQEGRIFIAGRHESSSNERAVMIKNIDVRSMSKPIFISRTFGGRIDTADEETEDDEEYDDYEILQDMNSLNLTQHQSQITRSVSAPAVNY